MHDMHVHLDFMADPEGTAREALAAGTLLFANTATPDGFAAARKRFAPFPNVRTGIGLHPWWVEKADAADRFIGLLPETRFVGEVGLDFAPRHETAREAQAAAFARIARTCAERGGKVLSVHSVRAAREALDILESAGTLKTCTCIFHWFTGPSDQLKRAVQAGCLFSVGPRMTATRKGREYVKAIPATQLLLETDLPANRGDACPFEDVRRGLEEASRAIAAIKGEAALEAIASTSRAIMS